MYLARWVSQQGLPSFTDTRLANPTTWAISARAFVELRSEWPGYAKRITSARNAEVERVGENLQSALESVTLVKDPPNPPKANHALFDWLHNNYLNKHDELDKSLRKTESAYLAEWKTTNDRESSPDIDLWGGGAQQLTGYTPSSTTMGGTRVPNNIGMFVPIPCRLADYLKLTPGLTVSFVPSWTAIWMQNLGIGGLVKEASAILKVSVTVYWDRVPILRRAVTSDRVQNGAAATPGKRTGVVSTMGDPHEAFNALWEQRQNLKARFERGSWEESLSDHEKIDREQLLGTVTKQVENQLEELQKQAYKWISGELNRVQLNAAALRLSGAKALLDAFIHLGMPRAVESDDYLRAFLNGSQSLLDAEQVSERYAGAQGGGPNVRVGIFQDAKRRVEALHGVLKGYLDQIEGGAHTESQPLLSTALLRSSVVNHVVRLADASDNTPPETTITSGPPDSTTSTSATFEFSSSEANSTFLCQLDDGPRSPCSPPMSYDSLAPGTHTFQVQTIDYAGNIDTTPASHSWTVQTVT
jgi:hypothetical protein